MLKALIYVLVTIITIWALSGINFEKMLKKNKIYEARVLYLLVCMSISYLVVNFLYDFFTYSKFV